jgi:DNA-directed RNA polymerase I, II, and III subunit RPABC2
MDEKYEDDDYEEVEDEDEEEEEIPVSSIRKLTKPPASMKINKEADEEEEEDDDEEDDDIEIEDEDLEEDEDEEEEYDEDRPVLTETGRSTFTEMDNFSDDDDEDEEDENYLQKFDENTQKKIIVDYHPELQSHNYDEIDILSRVVRDENRNIIDPLHKTLPFITRYEKARILGERAKQINGGAKPMIEVDPNIIDGYLIALKEYDQKAIPFIVKRPLPNGGCEYWRFEDLEIIE